MHYLQRCALNGNVTKYTIYYPILSWTTSAHLGHEVINLLTSDACIGNVTKYTCIFVTVVGPHLNVSLRSSGQWPRRCVTVAETAANLTILQGQFSDRGRAHKARPLCYESVEVFAGSDQLVNCYKVQLISGHIQR